MQVDFNFSTPSSSLFRFIGLLFLFFFKDVIMKISFLLRSFLWKGSDLSFANAKVVMDTICLPMEERGLAVKNLKVWWN
jgi:hypothetical protein